MHILISLCIWLGVIQPDNVILVRLQERSRSEEKPLAVYFAGSDWCTNCAKYKQQVLTDTHVDSLLNYHYISYTADFPQRVVLADSVVTCNEMLAERLNPEGLFPLLVIASSDLKVIRQISLKDGLEGTKLYLQQHQ